MCHWLVSFFPTSSFISSFLATFSYRQSSFIFFIYWTLSVPFLIGSCSHWILHTDWWGCAHRGYYCFPCFWYLHKMYFEIKYCFECKWSSMCNYIENISLSIFNIHSFMVFILYLYLSFINFDIFDFWCK